MNQIKTITLSNKSNSIKSKNSKLIKKIKNNINKIINEINKYIKNKHIEKRMIHYFTYVKKQIKDKYFLYKNELKNVKISDFYIFLESIKKCKFKFKNFFITLFFEENTLCLIITSRDSDSLYNQIKFLISLTNLKCELEEVSQDEKVFDTKRAISLGIDICKKIGIKKVELTDNTFFYCNPTTKINMPNIRVLQKRKTWYQDYFQFYLSLRNDKKRYKEILHKLKEVKIKNVKNINGFENFLQANHKNTKNINGVHLLSFFNSKSFSEKQCDILLKKEIIEKIFQKYKLKSLKGKRYTLYLKKWMYSCI